MTTPTRLGAAIGGSGHRAPAAVSSGFGTLLNEEMHLETVIAEGIEQAERFQAGPLARILRNHRVQVAAIVTLIGDRTTRLPLPGRFRAPASDEWLRGASRRIVTGPATAVRLAKLHDDLADRYSHWHWRSPVATDEPLYNRALRQHEEMAWMLHALLNERLPLAGPAMAEVRPTEPERVPSAV